MAVRPGIWIVEVQASKVPQLCDSPLVPWAGCRSHGGLGMSARLFRLVRRSEISLLGGLAAIGLLSEIAGILPPLQLLAHPALG